MDKFMQVIKSFDTLVLAVYQRFAHWFQKIFGPTNFALARACLICLCFINFTCFGMAIIILKDFAIITIVLMALVGALLFLGFRICARSEKEYYRKAGNNFLNKNEKTFLKWRLFVILFFGFRISVFIKVLATDFNVSRAIIYGMIACHYVIIIHFFYFISCTPLPPGESKVKTKWKAMKEKLSGSLSSQPNVTPA